MSQRILCSGGEENSGFGEDEIWCIVGCRQSSGNRRWGLVGVGRVSDGGYSGQWPVDSALFSKSPLTN